MKTYRDGFFEKIPVFPKFGKNGQNLSKNRPFSIFLKNLSLVFRGFLDIIRGYWGPHFAENRFFKKIPVFPKFGKNRKIWANSKTFKTF